MRKGTTAPRCLRPTSRHAGRYLEYYVAVPWAGAVVVPLNIRWSAAENAYALNDSGATILFVDDAFLKHAAPLRGQVAALRRVIHIGDAAAPSGFVGYEALIEGHSPLPDAGRGGEDLAGIFYTGGTTGFPKGVMLSHRSQWSSAMAVLAVTEHCPQTVILHAAPMFHLADCSATISGRSPATPTRFHSSRRTACWRRSSAFASPIFCSCQRWSTC